jgi:sigma-B regulation protein RsbU (phosphoserine phosphatase)
VSGKGFPAALLVSTVASALRAFAEASPDDPRRVIDQLNRAVRRSAAAGKFVTLFYGELDHPRARLRYVNAGHVLPRLRHADGSFEMLSTGGFPLGLFENNTYEVGEVSLAPGDALLLVSDGIPDALDALHQDFGEERMDAIWREHAMLGTTRVLERLMGAVRTHRGTTPQTDDETALVVVPRGGQGLA